VCVKQSTVSIKLGRRGYLFRYSELPRWDTIPLCIFNVFSKTNFVSLNIDILLSFGAHCTFFPLNWYFPMRYTCRIFNEIVVFYLALTCVLVRYFYFVSFLFSFLSYLCNDSFFNLNEEISL
jgi:hypothetical protein